MTELIQQASDDQAALVLCFGAVALCGLVMHFSHHVGRLTGHIRLHGARNATTRSTQTASAAPRAQPMIREKAA